MLNYIDICGEEGHIHETGLVNFIKGYNLTLKSKETERKNYTKNTGEYEMENFKEIYEKNDYQRMIELSRQTIMEMEVIEMLKKDCGLVFDADLKANTN